MNKLGRFALVAATALPLILVLLLSSESLKEGLFSHSLGCLFSLTLLPISQYFMLFKSKIKDDGWKVFYGFGALIALFLSLAAWLA